MLRNLLKAIVRALGTHQTTRSRRACLRLAVDCLEAKCVPAICMPTGMVIDELTACRNWITYGPAAPYNPDQGVPATEAQVRGELEQLFAEGWRGLVTYSIDPTQGLQEVPRIAKEVGFVKVIAGVYWYDDAQLAREKTAAVDEQYFIDAFVVGNEGLWDPPGDAVPRYERAELETELAWFRTTLGKPVTTTEIGLQYLNDNTLLGLGDWVFPNIQPWHTPGTNVSDVASVVLQVKNEFQELQRLAPDRVVVLKEVWWTTDGDHAAGTEENQTLFFEQLAADDIFFIWGEAFDQFWKNEQTPFGTDGMHWGLHESDGTPKQVISQLMATYTSSYTVDDKFDRPDGTNIGPLWHERTNDLALSGGKLLGMQLPALASLKGITRTDVRLKARVDVTGGSHAELIARYNVATAEHYIGRLTNRGGRFYAEIVRKQTGDAGVVLSSTEVTTGVGALKFNVIGSSLKLRLDGVLVGNVIDNTLLGSGLAGIRAKGGSLLDNFALKR